MKFIKKILTIVFILSLSFLLIPTNKSSASGELVIMKTSDGNNMTYRGSSETVYRLKDYNYPTNQLRAVWISHFVGDVSTFQSESQFKSQLNTVMDNMESMGMNAMVFHVRTHNNAMYDSELNPRAKWWANVDFSQFDPLEWLIGECHRRGIEFHAWLNPYRVATDGKIPSQSVGSIPEGNPALDESNLIRVGNNIILDPGIPEVRDFIVESCMEIVENYDVDAIHFDDYFYISGADDTATRNKYNTSNLSLGDFRRKQVDLFIEELSNQLREYNSQNNKCVQLGISPSNVYKNGGYVQNPTYDANGNLVSPTYSNTGGFAHYDNYLYSDTLNWINNEWIDYIMPQCYHPIEQAAASFVEVTKWWSWAVRNKKVNFYTGIGIYMALDSNQYWEHFENEVQLQFLYAGQYNEFKGACFYKYSNLLSTHDTQVGHAVNLISNDYWDKRIPAAVLPYYAPLVAEVDPGSVVYNNGTITWEAVDNVRGYMVYQVPKGETLDKENINHVLKYTTATSINVSDVQNYTYYISSVNLANETSKGKLVNVSLSANDVIQAINALPTTITYENKEEVQNVLSLYNSLSESNKALVTNYQTLLNALNVIGTYEEVLEDLETYINSVDKHIKENRIIPTIEGISLKLKNQSDASLYNITTGELLKKPLKTTLIPITATFTKNGLTISKDFNINIGFVGTEQNGLFYRNDPSCMNPDDEGAYGIGISGYIGWSGHTFVVENNVLFIATTNYHEITDPNDIPGCNWSSVAGVYVNKSGQTINLALSQAFASKSSNNDGYYIISKNSIKATQHGFDPEAIVTLANGESIVIVRYLDSMINGAPMCPVSKVSIGTTAYIDKPTEVDETQALVDEVISLIDNITLPVSLSQKTHILICETKYNALEESLKSLITNYSKLQNALQTISELTEIEELNAYKEQELTKFINSINKSLYSASNQNVINSYIEQTRTAVNNSNDETAVDSAIQEGRTKVASVKTLDQELQELNDAKAEYIDKIDLLASSYDLRPELMVEINRIAENFKTQISVETRKSELSYIYSRAKATMKEYLENLEAAINNSIEEIMAYVNSLDYSQKEMQLITEASSELIEEVKQLVVIQDIKQVPTTFAHDVEKAHDDLIASIEELSESAQLLNKIWFKSNYREFIQTLIDDAVLLLEDAGSIDETNEIYNALDLQIANYISTMDELVDSSIASLNTKQSSYEPINNLISKTINSIKKAKTPTEINTIKESFENEYNTLYQEYLNQEVVEPIIGEGCSCNSSIVLVAVALLGVVVAVAFIKKNAFR